MSKSRKYTPPLIEETGKTLALAMPELIDLLQSVLDSGARFRFKALGTSMHPFIRDGDVVTVSPLSKSPLRFGDVAAFVQPDSGKLVLHRLVGKKYNACLIKGDSTRGGYEIVTRSELLGRVTAVERDGRSVGLGLGPEKVLIAFLTRTDLLYPLMSPVWRLIRPIFRTQTR